MPRIITLTTDFGLTDEYAGVMKGVILGRAPDATIIDLCHGIERQNIRQAALLIKAAYSFFPDNTIHVVVVDPGVGSSRKLILLQADGHLFLAPDNGVLGLLLKPEIFQAAYILTCKQYYITPASNTFHGRDILAPVAAQLAAGLAPSAVGPAVALQALHKLKINAPVILRDQKIITGEIINIDYFGNLQTNISGSILHDLYGPEKNKLKIRLKNKIITGIQTAYDHKMVGKILAIVGSRGYLEIAVNRGNAAQFLDAGIGAEITVSQQIKQGTVKE